MSLAKRCSYLALCALLFGGGSGTAAAPTPPRLDGGPLRSVVAPPLPRPLFASVDAGRTVVRYDFGGDRADGVYPSGVLAQDAAHAIYGTTQRGGGYGKFGFGTVYELVRTVKGASERVIHAFGPSSESDGAYPIGGPIVDKDGSVYGTTEYGGGTGCYLLGCGIIYKLTATRHGYVETVLHRFQGSDGTHPQTELVFDRYGALYGTASTGGIGSGLGFGVVFKLTPTAAGYRFNVIYRFGELGLLDGTNPVGLTLDARDGEIYGATNGGGIHGEGTLFKLTPKRAGYVERIIHSFTGADGAGPSTPTMDGLGALYATTFYGGTKGAGTAFKLAPTSTGYSASTIYNFAGQSDGANPAYQLSIGPNGTLYGSTQNGGGGGEFGNGTIFELIPTSVGYRETVLQRFDTKGGSNPTSGVLLQNGLLWATTGGGGRFGHGMIFALQGT
jgi:uncharacterized repeat protein (TIGR03803 family)